MNHEWEENFPAKYSVAISRVLYNRTKNQMVVVFRNGDAHIYYAVPHDVYVDFYLAGSRGNFFNTVVKDKYASAFLPSSWVEPMTDRNAPVVLGQSPAKNTVEIREETTLFAVTIVVEAKSITQALADVNNSYPELAVVKVELIGSVE